MKKNVLSNNFSVKEVNTERIKMTSTGLECWVLNWRKRGQFKSRELHLWRCFWLAKWNAAL